MLTTTSTARSGQTINIELVTTEKGAVSLPQFREGAVGVTNYVNAHGGINGAKIKLDICSTDSTPEGSIACANTAIDNHDVAEFVAVDLAADASVPKLSQAGVPMVMDFPAGTITGTNPDVTVFSGSAPAQIAGPFKYFAGQGGKSFAVVTVDEPAGHETIPPVTDPTSKALGIPIHDFYVNQTNPDFNSIILALKNAHADYVFVPLPEGQCTSLLSAANSLSFNGHLIFSSCSQYIAADSSASVGTYLTSPVYPYVGATEAPPAIKSQLETYGQVMSAAGYPASEYSSGDVLVGYAGMGDFIAVLQTIPASTPITASTAKSALHTAKFLGLFGEPMDCTGANAVRTDLTACTSSFPLVQVTKGGATPTLVPVGPGIFNEEAFLRSYLAP
jgi:branched-chain amino acid transport system substrate-binding protein